MRILVPAHGIGVIHVRRSNGTVDTLLTDEVTYVEDVQYEPEPVELEPVEIEAGEPVVVSAPAPARRRGRPPKQPQP